MKDDANIIIMMVSYKDVYLPDTIESLRAAAFRDLPLGPRPTDTGIPVGSERLPGDRRRPRHGKQPDPVLRYV